MAFWYDYDFRLSRSLFYMEILLLKPINNQEYFICKTKNNYSLEMAK
jgi:hypothetical protein